MRFFQHTTFASLFRSRAALVALSTTVLLAVAGTTWGYSALNRDVTLSLDGSTQQVSTMGDTVGEVLEAEGIEIGERDLVAPGLDEQIDDGDRISVRFARPLELTVDGDESTHWVTSTDVNAALGEIGTRYEGADLSVSRGASISRDGMALEVVTPKTLRIKVADKKFVKRELTALTAKDALEEMGVKVEKIDKVTPGKKATLEDGDKVVFTDFRVVKKRFANETVDFSTIEREDASMFEGETEVVRSGETGARDVTYRLTFRNGELVARKVLKQKVLSAPVDAIVRVGTKEEPTANFASGGTVWDRLAQCESGGNWAINTGNGYYGGLQFNLSTWRSYGGEGYPHQQSREYQIMIAERLRAANGGYGAWPHCSQQLGLPQ
ncbi:transglycosylase family protein [Nocardioides sp. GCM10027113]|uniref:transglycosylase family protein n=1 Tax=unclassified Nocardioides TaxID=2615069 RepID=UPI00362167C3